MQYYEFKINKQKLLDMCTNYTHIRFVDKTT